MFFVLAEDRRIQPVSYRQWVENLDDTFKARRVVAQDDIGDFRISTVFTGLDSTYDTGLDRPPLVFETAVFVMDAEPGDPRASEVIAQYSTWEEAEDGHARICRQTGRAMTHIYRTRPPIVIEPKVGKNGHR